MLPPRFSKAILDLHGQNGKKWLDNLPQFLAKYADRWSLTLHPPFKNLSYNYVCPATRSDGTHAVLKAHVKNNNSLDTEAAALFIYDGRGSARLLESDPDGGAILIERLYPGSLLSDLTDDDQATLIAAQVMKQLWASEQPQSLKGFPEYREGVDNIWKKIGVYETRSFPTIAEWMKGLRKLRKEFNGGTGPYPVHLIEIAEHLSDDLLSSQEPSFLLHGDFHHYNILSAEREPWLTIDPKGVVGDQAYEIGSYLRNPIHTLYSRSDLDKITARRVNIFSEFFGFDRTRIIGWSLIHTILSVWWSYEDHQEIDQNGLSLAEILVKLL
ncbi:MAG: hypothetical protein HC806_03085 [Anaerolineae bacterium]|nr:hypothetical protein [Anaerolineae bacterium]